MIINFLKEPFPHILIDEIFDENEMTSIWEEINFLTDDNKFKKPEETGSAFDFDTGIFSRKNKTIVLYDEYEDYNLSNIILHTRKFFDKYFMKKISEFDYIFKYIPETNRDTLKLGYYENGDYYHSHKDDSIFTIVTNLYKTPKKFLGGDLLFKKYDYNIPIKNNRSIIFPSIEYHSVDEVCMSEYNYLPGDGRYSITMFLYMLPNKLL